jgi:hypothetical protein
MRAIWILLFPFALAACDATGQAATFDYQDAWHPHGHARTDVALQVDTRACDAQTGARGDYGSPKFKACMRAHGWTFNGVESASTDDTPSNSSPPDIPNNDAQAAIDSANQQAATNAANAAAQQQFNDGMAAAQQTMNNAVFNQQ